MSGISYAADGVGGDFYWRDCVTGNYKQEAATAMVNASGLAETAPRQERERMEDELLAKLDRLEAGLLRQSDKPLDVRPIWPRSPEPSFFEFRHRFDDIDDDVDGSRRGSYQALLRLYYVQALDFSRAMVGLHCHRKDVSDPDLVKSRQDAEIKKAVDLYSARFGDRWGIPGFPY
ncbi:hypothetical protein [Propionibacterium freudenreichii]|uniref:hypothetical protein n=1 Tax=Propionibacterium freudenreichii TaxID=1744 RepID=UPI003851AB0B